MFSKILIANRGEIALRVIRACRELGVAATTIHSTADEDAMHVRLADESVCVGPPPAAQSYMNVPAIIAACELTGAEAVHPGYGFLSENAAFARTLEAHGIVFIGPSAEHLARMGDKIAARETARSLGLETVPGSSGAVRDLDAARREADRAGYPILVKASAGGGGRGMRAVSSASELASAMREAQAEALAAFGSDEVYIEKRLESPRHIEAQILGDGNGGALHFGERDCSLQRRRQKIWEEAPAPSLSTEERETFGRMCADAAAELGYKGAGTFEFLHADGKFYFMEMNARLQVEHPVSEEIHDVDLAAAQIAVAAGEGLPMRQSDVTPRGHAIECRVNAEHPRTFAPSPGRIEVMHVPGGAGIRIESAAFAGWKVPPHYDSLVAKLIVRAPSRKRCLARLRAALREYVIEGIDTTLPLFRDLVDDADVRDAAWDVAWLERWLERRDADIPR